MTEIADPLPKRFPGFPDRMELVPVPGAVFGTLLREIDDLAELKTLLHVLRLLHGQPRAPRFVRRASLLADAGLLAALGGSQNDSPEAAAAEALDRAVRRGTLLSVRVSDGTTEDACYLLNTRANERVVQDVQAGMRRLGELGPAPVPGEQAPSDDRPTIFELYEQNIGLLTPLLAEELREAAQTYPTAWIEDAFREAVANNKRSWRYVRRVLDNWASRGRGTSGTTWRRADPTEDSGRYLEGRYGRLVRH
ncbi:MAG: DnaD domain protein [Chloroflexota bacterium]